MTSVSLSCAIDEDKKGEVRPARVSLTLNPKTVGEGLFGLDSILNSKGQREACRADWLTSAAHI